MGHHHRLHDRQSQARAAVTVGGLASRLNGRRCGPGHGIDAGAAIDEQELGDAASFKPTAIEMRSPRWVYLIALSISASTAIRRRSSLAVTMPSQRTSSDRPVPPLVPRLSVCSAKRPKSMGRVVGTPNLSRSEEQQLLRDQSQPVELVQDQVEVPERVEVRSFTQQQFSMASCDLERRTEPMRGITQELSLAVEEPLARPRQSGGTICGGLALPHVPHRGQEHRRHQRDLGELVPLVVMGSAAWMSRASANPVVIVTIRSQVIVFFHDHTNAHPYSSVRLTR